jgi:hypothetical protein
MTRLPALYTARSDVDPAHQARVDDWYARRHAPDLIAAGFYTAQVYHSTVGTPLVCNLYEIPGPELFQTPAYRDVAVRDTEGPAVIALLGSRSNTVYEQVLTAGVPEDGEDWAAGGRAGAVDAPALTTLRFDLPPAAAGALREWYAGVEFSRLRDRPGFKAGRLCRRGPPHPTAASRDPEWLVVNEWHSLGDALADGPPEAAAARHREGLGAGLAALAYNVGHRRFRLAAPGPGPGGGHGR